MLLSVPSLRRLQPSRRIASFWRDVLVNCNLLSVLCFSRGVMRSVSQLPPRTRADGLDQSTRIQTRGQSFDFTGLELFSLPPQYCRRFYRAPRVYSRLLYPALMAYLPIHRGLKCDLTAKQNFHTNKRPRAVGLFPNVTG